MSLRRRTPDNSGDLTQLPHTIRIHNEDADMDGVTEDHIATADTDADITEQKQRNAAEEAESKVNQANQNDAADLHSHQVLTPSNILVRPQDSNPLSESSAAAASPSPSPYASSLRTATESRRRLLAQRVRVLAPSICRNVMPFFLRSISWLLVTLAAPAALLSLAYSHDSYSDSTRTTLLAIGWTLLSIGMTYLVFTLMPILTRGGCCMPKRPEKHSAFMQEEIRHAPDSDSSSVSHTILHPQQPVHHIISGHPVYMLVNPYGQHGAKCRSMCEIIQKMLEQEMKCSVRVRETQYAGHLEDLGRDEKLLPLEWNSNDAASSPNTRIACIILIGGDGSFSEFINGYMHRCSTHNIPPASRIPLVLVPGGTGNSLARDLYEGDLSIETVLSCIRNSLVRLMDVNLLTDSSSPPLRLYSTNVISYGLVGDTAVIAEDYRMLGDARYDLCAVWCVMRKVTSDAKYVLEGLGGKENRRNGRKMKFDGEDGKESDGEKKDGEITAASDSSSRHSLTLTGARATAFFNHTQHFAKALRACPYALLDDGLLDVIVCDDAERKELLTMFQQLPTGAHTDNKAVSYYQVKKVKFTRATNAEEDENEPSEGVLNLDGENFCVRGTVTIEVLPRQIPIIALR